MRNYKKSLIYEYVTGKKEVPQEIEDYTKWRQQYYDNLSDEEVKQDIGLFIRGGC